MLINFNKSKDIEKEYQAWAESIHLRRNTTTEETGGGLLRPVNMYAAFRTNITEYRVRNGLLARRLHAPNVLLALST